MNSLGLQITGTKMSSPAQTKKSAATTASTVSNKKKQFETKPLNKKPAIPTANNFQKSPATQKKETGKKVEQKTPQKQQPKKKQQKKDETSIKVQQKLQIPEAQVEQIKIEESQAQETAPVIFQVLLRYNHYKDKFTCVNGVLSFAIPNEKYCFGLVFKGNYQPLIRNFKTRQIIQPLTTGKADEFSWKIQQSQTYEIQIQQDEEQQSKYERHSYKAPEKTCECPLKKNQRVNDLTQEMKKMGIDQLGSSKHKQLLEQRDLEDILYS